MSSFCPRCFAPIETASDDARLCDRCGWYGDKVEVLTQPPQSSVEDPTLAIMQTLAMYRDVCRNELLAELTSGTNHAKVRALRQQATNSLIELYLGLSRLAQPAKRKLVCTNGMLFWPEDWLDRHYHIQTEPCDMLIGPCACGCWHRASEPWVQALLIKHDAEIIQP